MNTINRRSFLKTSFVGGVAFLYRTSEYYATIDKQEELPARVAITTGDNRADLAFRALQHFKADKTGYWWPPCCP